MHIGIDRAVAAHRDDHGRNVCDLKSFTQDLLHFLWHLIAVIRREEHSCFLLVADEAVESLQEVPALQRNTHIADNAIELFLIFFAELNDLFHDLLIHIDLDHDRVCFGENFIALLFKQCQKRVQIRALGDRAGDISVLVKDCEPRPHTIWNPLHIADIYLVPLQLAQYILAKC